MAAKQMSLVLGPRGEQASCAGGQRQEQTTEAEMLWQDQCTESTPAMLWTAENVGWIRARKNGAKETGRKRMKRVIEAKKEEKMPPKGTNLSYLSGKCSPETPSH